MLFLSSAEVREWTALAEEIQADGSDPFDLSVKVRSNLIPAFHYYIGTLLVITGQEHLGQKWITAGILTEEGGYFSNAFLLGFLGRYGGRLIMPDSVFADPRPFMHFASVPIMKDAREKFVRQCGKSLPDFHHPLMIMDIGCGNGALTLAFLEHLRSLGKLKEIGEILLIDPSPGMLKLAKETVGKAYPQDMIKIVQSQIQGVSDGIKKNYDIALSSLAYHHMPFETKLFHLKRLREWIDHFIIFELSANNDSPEIYSPELALSIYQSYGAMIDFIFSHDASVEVAIASVDRFLMTEAVSMLTMARGQRMDYHMLRNQWHDLFKTGLGSGFTCLCDAPCYGDEHIELFTMHYGRG
jgi:SAM-dependent methyltransferase